MWQRPQTHTPLATFEYAWLHRRLQRNIQRSKKNSLTEDLRTCKVTKLRRWVLRKKLTRLTRSSKPVVLIAVLRTQKILIRWILTTRSWKPLLILLDHAPTPPTIDKISPILPSSRSSPPALLVAVRMIRLMKIWLLTMVILIVAVTKTRMTVEVLFMQHVPWRTA